MKDHSQYISWMKHMKSTGKMLERNRWIIDTIKGVKKDEEIFLQTSNFILITNGTWKSTDDIDQMHLLCFYDNRKIRTIRDLKQTDVNILKMMRDESLNVIQERFGVNKDELRVFFHYPPSTYILHIHFVHINSSESAEWNEWSFDHVLNCLESENNYFKNVRM